VLQGFVIRNLRQDVHREFLDAAVLVGEVKAGADYYSYPKKYQLARFKPRGWSWIDPQKEVAAYKMAVRCGFMTQEDVVAQTANGADIEDVMNARREELDMAGELDLVFDSDPAQVNDKGIVQPLPPRDESDIDAPNDPAAPIEPGSADAKTTGAAADDNANPENPQ
jgi:capsid protein